MVWNKEVLLSLHFIKFIFMKVQKPKRGGIGTEWNTLVMLMIFLLNQKSEVYSYVSCQNTAQNHDIRMGNKICHKCYRV